LAAQWKGVNHPQKPDHTTHHPFNTYYIQIYVATNISIFVYHTWQ